MGAWRRHPTVDPLPQMDRQGEVKRGRGGVGVCQREAEPLALKPNVATVAAPHGWGPLFEAASKEKRSLWWANYTKGRSETIELYPCYRIRDIQ